MMIRIIMMMNGRGGMDITNSRWAEFQMRFSGRSRPLRIGEFFFYHHDDDNDGDYNDDYNDDCRYDQSTAEAFRAVQKSGEMVMIIVLYHFISCNPFFGVTSKSKVSILIPWRHPSNPRIPSNAPRYPPKPLQTSPWKVHTTILQRPPCRLWNPPRPS